MDRTVVLAPFTWLFSLFGVGGAVAVAQSLRPKLGVGVFIRSAAKPGCVLLGMRKGATGAGTWALPGGHLECGETWAECASREVLEETGLEVDNLQTGTVINAIDAETNYHYVVIFMVADVPAGAVPANLEPEKCEGWEWQSWSDECFFDEAKLFPPLAEVRSLGFNPFIQAGLGAVMQAPDAQLPPYCCCILQEQPSGCILLEERDANAAVAAGKLTCFGGKREPGEDALACIQRELREELGYVTSPTSRADVKVGCVESAGLRRAVDLYVDSKLIAWFFVADAPARDAPIVYEDGRGGVWLHPGAIDASGDDPLWLRVSPWHRVVLQAWKRGERRADFTSATK